MLDDSADAAPADRREPASGAAQEPAPDAAAPAADSARARRLRRLTGSSAAYMAVVLAAVYALFAITAPHAFPTAANGRNIVNDAAILLVMATGMTYVMVAAGFDLSIGSVLVFGGICGSKTMTWLGTDNALTIAAGLAASLLGGLAWGLFNGFCVTRLRVPALITTLGSLGAALGIAQLMTNGNDVRDVPLTLIHLSTATLFGFSYLVWVAVLVVVLGGLVLATTRFGRHTYIVGSNIEAARRAGIDVNRHLMKLYALSGLLAGMAGMMSLTRFATTTIGGHSQDSLEVITGVVLGGTSLYGGAGTIIGTVVGIFIPAVLNNGLVVKNVQPFWQQVAIGFILIAAVYVDQIKRRARDRS